VPSSLKNLANTFVENKELERSIAHTSGRRAMRSRNVPFVSEELAKLERMSLALFDAVLFPGWSFPFHIYEPFYCFMVSMSSHFVIYLTIDQRILKNESQTTQIHKQK